MQTLMEIELIRQLKARYFRALDTNDWALFAQCLTEDCRASYGDGKYSFDGRDAIVGFMRKNMSPDTVLTMHNGHHPEIEIEDETSASGIWYLQDIVIDLKGAWRLYGGALYRDRYSKGDGQWRISETGYTRTFECAEPLGERHKVLVNMFAPATGGTE